MKKKLSLLLASMLVATMVPVSSFAVKVSQTTVKDVEVGDNSESFSILLEKETFDKFQNGALQFDVDNGVTFNEIKMGENDDKGAIDATTTVVASDANSASVFKEVTLTDKAYVLFTFDLDFTDAVEGKDVTVKLTDIGKDETGVAGSYKVAKTVAAASSEVLAMTVADKDKTVSEKGGKLSQVTIKNFNKTGAEYLKIEVQNAKLDTTNTKVYVDGKTASLTNGFVDIDTNTNTVIIEPEVTALDSDFGSVELTATLTTTNDNDTLKELASKTVKIGEVVDYAVTVKVTETGKKDIPTIVGGEEKDVTITIEGTKGAITKGRKYTLTLDGATFKANPTEANSKIEDEDMNDDSDEFTFYVKEENVDKLTLSATIKASATAKDGVATVKVSSRDLDEDVTLDIAKIEKAFGFDTKVTDIKRGESVTTADIVITETEVGQLGTNESIYLKVDGKIAFNELPKAEGTNGIKFDDAKWSKATDSKYAIVEIPVATRSKSEPATVTISGLAMDMLNTAVHDRTYQVDVYVGAKGLDFSADAKTPTKYADLDYAKCVAEYAIRKPQVVFTLGSADYTVNGVKYTLEAPVFTKDDRTMLPVGPLGLALGLDVSYNASTQTATFIDRDTNLIVTIKEGASVLYMNGVEMPMTTAAITVNGRIFVPVSSVTQAFGLPIAWDAATSTVTVN